MPGYLLFFAYTILLSWLLTRIRFIKNAGLANRVVIALFIIKIAAGVFAGWMYHSNLLTDTWAYHTEGLKEYQLLFSNPGEYFTNLFYTGYTNGYDGVLQAHDSYWNDLKTNLMIKFISVLDIFSFGNYYVNVVLYNFLVFFGSVALYRLFRDIYSDRNKLAVIGCFLLPSLLFFSSTIHKDGLIFTALNIVCLFVYHAMRFHTLTKAKLLLFFLCLLVIFLFRSYVVIILLPALVAWVIATKVKYPPAVVFTLVFLMSAAVFFCSAFFSPSANLPSAVIQKQAEFQTLAKANSYIGVPVLEPGIKSFAIAAPTAFAHTLLRPFFSDHFLSPLLIPFAAEWFLYLLLILLFLFFRRKGEATKPFFLFCIFFFIFLMLIIGYTVPVLWAIVRYRSIYIPFIITPLLLQTDWKKLGRIFSIIK